MYYAHVRDAAADLQPPRRHEQRVSSKKIYALYCNANLRLASTDWYFCVCWAAGMTCPASAVRDGPFPCFPLLSMLCGMHSTDTGVYYAHARDAGGDLRPLRRHEQSVSLKKSDLIWS